MNGYEGSEGVAPIINLGSRWRYVNNLTLWPFYRPERVPVFVEEEAGWAPEPVWTVLENRKSLASAEIRPPDLAVRSQSL